MSQGQAEVCYGVDGLARGDDSGNWMTMHGLSRNEALIHLEVHTIMGNKRGRMRVRKRRNRIIARWTKKPEWRWMSLLPKPTQEALFASWASGIRPKCLRSSSASTFR